MACKRHLRDRELAAAPGGHPAGWFFDARPADVAFAFYETVLRLPDTVDENGFNKPFLLEPALAFIVGSLMGWYGADSYRRFREAYIEMGKGNAKTPLVAGLGLFGLTMDRELAAEIYAAAVTKDQARVLFRDAERMVEVSPDLAAKVTATVNNLAAENFCFFRPYSREQGQQSGPRPHMALVDELHEHPSAEVLNKLKAGFKFRKQPLAVMITNSGFDRTSVCFEQHQHAEAVCRGVITDDRYFAYVCALDEGEDPLEDPSCWIKANPLLGVTISTEYLRRQVENAKHIPSERNTVLRLNFCVWTTAQSRAISIEKWLACPPAAADEALVGATAYGALDLGQSDDFSAWLRIFILEIEETLYVALRARFWLPEKALERFPNRPYEDWQRRGLLEITEGETTDYDVIEEAVLEDAAREGIREIAYDNRFAEQMAQHLTGAGLTMVNTLQGFALNEACRKLFDLVTEARLLHGHHAILTWMASNFVIRHGIKGDIRPDKDRAPEKIDGIVALIMALDRWIKQPDEPPSVYETRGLTTI